ncbi:hypothetical protein QQF64_034407 [Cirrhinus molitorella]|uniref:MADF domain-containing protein n=1 Tax=Cirrhinus molitorella TaxID=172907 RepID=A0ABR3L193_9TELE
MSKNISDSTETRDDGTQTKAPMKWTEKHDVLLCKQILCEEPHKYKKSSVNRGKAWSTIADTLNYSQDLTFKVTQRSVRDRFRLIQKKYKSRNDKGTTDLDDLIEEITEKGRAAVDNRKKSETDRPKAEEAKKRESQSTKRLHEEGDDWKNNERKKPDHSKLVQLLKQLQEQLQVILVILKQQQG